MSSQVTFKNLAKYSSFIHHAISTNNSGTMKKEGGFVHHANLLKFSKTNIFEGITITMHQVHGNNVAIVENARDLVLANTDGMVSDKKNIALSVLTADCLPILLYDPKNNVIGVAHAGSKGLRLGIIHNTVTAMVTNYGSIAKDILVGIGPHIEALCYEVGEEIKNNFLEIFPNFKDFIITQDDKNYINLQAVAMQCLVKEGILSENIEITTICTKCSPDYYSYRRGDKFERFVSMISLL